MSAPIQGAARSGDRWASCLTSPGTIGAMMPTPKASSPSVISTKVTEACDLWSDGRCIRGR